jgi:hypothetical protein
MLVKVLKSISNDGSMELFRLIATQRSDSELLRSKTKMTRKQYYSRMSRMMEAGLIGRKHGKHTLTTFGKIVYYAQTTIENATNYYWNLKAIDSLEMSNDVPVEERKKLVDNLIENDGIREILARKPCMIS